MKFLIFNTLFAICCLIGIVRSYKILGVFPCPAYSHYTLGFRLMKELADRGHEVSFITSHPQKEPIKNFRDISVAEIQEELKPFFSTSNLEKLNEGFYYSQLLRSMAIGKAMTRSVLKHKNVQKLLKSEEKFDVVIVEQLLNDAFFVLAHKFECPLILLTPGPTMMFNNYLFANPAPSTYVTNLFSTFNPQMSFWERIQNTYMQILGEGFCHLEYLPMQNEVLHEIIPDAPDLNTLIYNASLLFTISDVSLGHPVPLQQNIKEIGGYHVPTPKSLPKNIQTFMDSSKEGVVVFSMGSNLKSSNLNAMKRKSNLNIFSKIKQNVLWKFEEDLPDTPKNVKIFNWIPQSDVLAHPNTVAFISHGGLLGTTEAVYHGVPILGIPVFWDQGRNIQNVFEKGMGLKVDLANLGEEEFENNLNEIINNQKFKDEAKKCSSVMKDKLVKPLDEAVFWIEYVVRHKGAPHLRSAALSLKWYQLYSLDIILFIIFVIFSMIIGVSILLRCICRRKKIGKNKKNN